jgi:hypothetical protein
MSSSTVPNTPITIQRSIWLSLTNQLSFVVVIASVSEPSKASLDPSYFFAVFAGFF